MRMCAQLLNGSFPPITLSNLEVFIAGFGYAIIYSDYIYISSPLSYIRVGQEFLW